MISCGERWSRIGIAAISALMRSMLSLVAVNGSALPAVRVELDPLKLFHYGVGLEDIRSALASANANSPKGSLANFPPLARASLS